MGKKVKILEKDVTRQIRDYLKYKKIWHWKQFQTLGSKPGVSDILGIYKGRFLAIEVKKPGGKLSEHQVKFLDIVNSEGGIGFMATCIEDVDANLP